MYKHKKYYSLLDEYLKKRDNSFQRFDSQPDRNVEDILTLAKRDVERREVCLLIYLCIFYYYMFVYIHITSAPRLLVLHSLRILRVCTRAFGPRMEKRLSRMFEI